MVLHKINSPHDLKQLDRDDLVCLADEIRTVITQYIEKFGGHLSSNLGFIEATIALHYVFDSPQDKLIFDVSHQSLTHKILTGRKAHFFDDKNHLRFSEYTSPFESSHDHFKVGHTSSSLSYACGLARSQMQHHGQDHVIAIIGDGSMSGGMAFEGLNNTIGLERLIIIFNDNEMSIAQNQGGMYENFALLRQTKGQAANNFFKAFGLDYVYLEAGNDLSQLIATFEKIKGSIRPIVVHLHTEKGHGDPYAVAHKELTHYQRPHEPGQCRSQNFYFINQYFVEKAKKDPELYVITPATPLSTEINFDFRKQLGKQYIDVGICEQHALTFAAGLAKGGSRPIVQICSSFLQRAYDQLNQDIAMNNLPVIILLAHHGISGGDCTHNGMFDISLVNDIPNLLCFAPVNLQHCLAILNWAMQQKTHPVLIRVSNEDLIDRSICTFKDQDVFKYTILDKGKDLAIIALGSGLTIAKELATIVRQKHHLDPTIINPTNYSQLDTSTLEEIKKTHSMVITIEDGMLHGGFGQTIASYYGDDSALKVFNFGVIKDYCDLLTPQEIMERSGMTSKQIYQKIKKYLN